MQLRKFQKSDLPLMKVWLEADHIKQYFGSAADWLTEIEENLQSAWAKHFIAETNEPVGFVQYYYTHEAPPGEWSDEPLGTIGIDYCIGNKNCLNKGFGSQLIELLINEIKKLPNVHRIIADPTEENGASIKILRKNGFVKNANGIFCLNLQPESEFKVFRAKHSDLAAISKLFSNTVLNINIQHYSEAQTAIWAARAETAEMWQKKIANDYFLVAKNKYEIIGFASLCSNGCIDMLYTHHRFQNQGIAKQLLNHLECKARILRLAELFSEVSLTALAFFEKNGFLVLSKQTKILDNVEFTNFKMHKILSPLA